MTKIFHKFRSLKRPKMKNLNIVKQLKKHTKYRNTTSKKKNFKGKVIDGLHELYTLTAGMMLGIRSTIGRSTYFDKEGLTLDDFNHVDKMIFPAAGSNKPPYFTPPHSLVHTFKFKSYTPKVFERIREYFGIDRANYMLSVCGNYNFLEFISNSKSGQFFFYSHDGKYMIKTQTKEENKFLKKILPHYYQYMTENPHSFVCRILGMHRVKMYHLRRKVHFVIMESVFDTPQEIHTIYDLKGSLVGRESTKEARAKGCVLKDMDLINDNRKFHLGSKKEDFMTQIEKDAQFLASLNIMDYSLLVGIHDRSKRESIPPVSNDATMPSTTPHSNTPFRRMLAKQQREGDDEENIMKDISRSNDSNDNTDTDNNTINNTAIKAEISDENTNKDVLNQSKEMMRRPSVLFRKRSSTFDFSEDDNEDLEEFDEFDEYDFEYDDDDGDSELGEITNSEYIKSRGNINRILDDDEIRNSPDASPDKIEESQVLKLEGELVGRLFRSPDDIIAISNFSQKLDKSSHSQKHFTFGPGSCEQHPWTSRIDKGINSRSFEGRGNEIYYVGIIDILQQYNTHKKAEHFFKSFVNDSTLISAVCSKAYANRFADFLNKNID
jgi:hypothetical protein